MVKKKMTLEEKLEEAIVKDAPYEVSDNWIVVKLGSICNKMQYGYTEKASVEKNGPHFLRITDIQDNYVNWKSVPYCSITDKDYLKYKINKGDIVIARTGATTGKNYIINDEVESVFASYLIRIQLDDNIYNKYISYYMNSSLYWNQIIEKRKGSAQPGVNAQKLALLTIPLPPLKEQQRIVERIESLFEKLDDAKELIEEARDDFEKRKSAILEKAFRGELTKEWRNENDIINNYKRYILKDLLKPMTNKKPDLAKVDFRYIDIDAIDNKKQVVGEPKVIETIKAPSRASREVIKGDVVFSTVRPYLRNIAYITEELEDCIASTGFYICRCKEMLDSRFLYMVLCSDSVLKYYTSLMKGDNSPSIRKSEFEGLSINLPSIEEQKEIVRILDKFLEEEAKIEELTQLEEQIEIIKKSILSKAFRGKLGTNFQNDKSALELLKEILKNN